MISEQSLQDKYQFIALAATRVINDNQTNGIANTESVAMLYEIIEMAKSGLIV